jgi:O-antigen/teichoic acid export membrane protein
MSKQSYQIESGSPERHWVSQLSQLIGSMGYSAVMWLLALLLIHQTGLEEFGRYSAALAVSAPIFMCANARGRLLLAGTANLPAPVSSYVLYRFIAASVAAVLSFVFSAFGMGNAALIVLAVVLFKTIEAISDILYAVLQRNSRAELVGYSQGLKASLFLVLLLIGWALRLESAASYVGLLVCGLAALLLFDRFLVRLSHSRVRDDLNSRDYHHHLREVFSHLRPMMLIAFLASAFSILPRIFLESYHGYYEVGQYSALMLFNTAAMVIVAALGQPYLRSLGQANASGNVKLLRKYMIKMLLIAIIVALSLSLILGIFGRTILSFVLDGTRVIPGSTIAVLLVVIFLNSLCLLFWYLLAAIGVRRGQVWLAICALSSMLALGWLLIPAGEVEGALLSEALALGIQALLAAAIVRHAIISTSRAADQGNS